MPPPPFFCPFPWGGKVFIGGGGVGKIGRLGFLHIPWNMFYHPDPNIMDIPNPDICFFFAFFQHTEITIIVKIMFSLKYNAYLFFLPFFLPFLCLFLPFFYLFFYFFHQQLLLRNCSNRIKIPTFFSHFILEGFLTWDWFLDVLEFVCRQTRVNRLFTLLHISA